MVAGIGYRRTSKSEALFYEQERRMLKFGSKGRDVERLQILLNGSLKPSPRLRVDGDFGQRCHAALMRLQRSRVWSMTVSRGHGPGKHGDNSRNRLPRCPRLL